METLEDNDKSNNIILINDEIKESLLEISKWAKFLSILGFIWIGLMGLATLIMIVFGNSNRSFSNIRGGTQLTALIYIIIIVFYYFPINYLYKSSLNIKQGISSNSQNLLSSGFENMKLFYKFIGILTIVLLSICALSFLMGILISAIKYNY